MELDLLVGPNAFLTVIDKGDLQCL
jgi:hypothetical protein